MKGIVCALLLLALVACTSGSDTDDNGNDQTLVDASIGDDSAAADSDGSYAVADHSHDEDDADSSDDRGPFDEDAAEQKARAEVADETLSRCWKAIWLYR